MSTTFANSIDSNPIYAARAENDKDGNRIDTTYAKLTDIPSVPVTDVTVNGTSVVSSGTAAVVVPTATSDLTNDSGFITLSDVPAQQQADWTESDTSDPSYIANKPNLAAVATSGQYSDLSGTPTINNVPAVTSSDDDKVLKASYTGGVGSYSWETAESGGTYTAGDGIAIDQNNEVSVRRKDDFNNALKVTQEQGGGGYADLMSPELAPNYEDWKALADNGYIHREYDDVTGTTNIEFRYRWDRVDGNPLGMVCTSGDNTRQFEAECHLLYISSKESYTTLLATSRLEADYFTPARDAFDSVWVYCLGSLVDTTDDGYVFQVNFTVPGDHYSLFNAIAFSVHGQDFSNISDTVQSSFLGEQHVLALQGFNIYIVGDTIPVGDLYVQVDQIYDPVSAFPQSGFAVDEAISYVRQLPYASESDSGHVLVYDDFEGAHWTDQSSASIARNGNALEVRLRNASGSNNSGLSVSTTEVPTSITGTVKSGGPNSSYYATFTKSISLDPDTDTVNIVGFESSVPSEITSPVYAVVVAGDTWASGTLTGGIICDHNSGSAINLADPTPCKAYVITDPSDQYATSTFFSDVDTFMVFAVSGDDVYNDHGTFYGSFIDEWSNNGLYSALEQYAVALTQPSGSVTFEIPSIPVVTRGLYVENPLPASTSADEGKVLTVDSNGDPTWATGGGGSTYTAGNGIDITNDEISVDTSVVATQTDLSGKQDTLTAGTNVSISNNVISATDTTYSAGEGIDITNNEISVEAPVDIVAGPGIVIDNPDGNTLRVSTDEDYETVLWSGTAATSVTCSEAITNFERLKVYITPAAVTTDTMIQIVEMIPGKFGTYMMLAGYQSNLFHIYGGRIASSGMTTLKTENGFHMWVPITSGGSVGNESSNSKIARVVGVHRISGGN